MSSHNLVRAFGDAVVLSFKRTFDKLEITLRLWDESEARLVAEGVTLLEDMGTWECDGLVRYPALDGDDVQGYAVVDTDAVPTLRFAARTVEFLPMPGD
jgi:hypothetical protein